ncbi:MAG TPA: glycosyltransferase, partial [Tepidisphaeraceae bacterium]|nr:glycosyltransferase [Tepidisphaeraceae bacterium]
RASNFLGVAPGGGQSGGIRQTVQTMTITLDWLLDQRPAPKVIKIDVEGAEISVLKGATRLLKEVRPVLLCEISKPSVETAREIFRANGYTLFDWHNRTAGPLDQPTWDTLAVPSELAEQRGSLHLQPSARPRRVLFVMHRLNISGVSHHTLLLAKGLRRLGWEIAVAARDLAPGTPMGQEAMEAEGLRVFQVPFPGYGLNLRNISAAMRTMFALNRVVKTFGADVLHVHAPTLTPYVGLAGWRNRIPTVSTLHVETLGRNKVWLGQMGNRLFSRMFGDYSVAISTDMARLLVNCLGVPPARVRTILHGVDDQRFRPPSPQERLDARAAYGLAEDARVVCMIAVLEERKNHAMLVRMLAELRHRGMDVIALCAGAGEEDDRQRIEKLAAEAGVADLVRLIGYRDSRQVMWASDASLLLSTQEGFGLVTIESMLCGLVPLRTPAAGAADQIVDQTNGFIVPFGDHRFLADRLQTLFTQPELRKKMGEAAREFALAHFSADRMAQETAQVYLDAIARRSPERESERP